MKLFGNSTEKKRVFKEVVMLAALLALEMMIALWWIIAMTIIM